MTDEIRKKHEGQRSYVLETQGDAAYLNQSIKSGLTISEVDALFKALDEAPAREKRLERIIEDQKDTIIAFEKSHAALKAENERLNKEAEEEIIEVICPRCNAEFEPIPDHPKEGILCPNCKGGVKGVLHPRKVKVRIGQEEWDELKQSLAAAENRLAFRGKITSGVFCDGCAAWEQMAWEAEKRERELRGKVMQWKIENHNNRCQDCGSNNNFIEWEELRKLLGGEK